jgi:hypothetical protein
MSRTAKRIARTTPMDPQNAGHQTGIPAFVITRPCRKKSNRPCPPIPR